MKEIQAKFASGEIASDRFKVRSAGLLVLAIFFIVARGLLVSMRAVPFGVPAYHFSRAGRGFPRLLRFYEVRAHSQSMNPLVIHSGRSGTWS